MQRTTKADFFFLFKVQGAKEKVRKTDGWIKREEGEGVTHCMTTKGTKREDKVQEMQRGRRKGKGSGVWNKQIKRDSERDTTKAGVRNGRQRSEVLISSERHGAGKRQHSPAARQGHATVYSGGQVTSNMSNRPSYKCACGEKLQKHFC